ncbi:uncharacterized protein METZ01_LOCUS352790 [marine metagenome]|uniref:Uncharacterized protein n=1 Tax=marine metagenome TaxID=408172 RepID=A0A382RQK2_9ZZZZ
MIGDLSRRAQHLAWDTSFVCIQDLHTSPFHELVIARSK